MDLDGRADQWHTHNTKAPQEELPSHSGGVMYRQAPPSDLHSETSTQPHLRSATPGRRMQLTHKPQPRQNTVGCRRLDESASCVSQNKLPPRAHHVARCRHPPPPPTTTTTLPCSSYMPLSLGTADIVSAAFGR